MLRSPLGVQRLSLYTKRAEGPSLNTQNFGTNFEPFVQNVSNFSRNVRNLGQNLEHYKLIRLKIWKIISSVFGRNIENLGQHLDHYEIFAQMISEI